jgi:magnesium chelatase family protein
LAAGQDRTTINLAPAILKKRTKLRFTDRARHDRAQRRIDTSAFADYSFVRELALDGVVHAIKGVLPVALKAQKRGKKALLVPEALNEKDKAYSRST